MFVIARALTITVLLISLFLTSARVLATDIVLDNGFTITNGGSILDEGASFEITESGSILVGDRFVNAVSSNADFIAVTNYGFIGTTGDFGSAISTNSNAVTITNFGSIRTTGLASHGISTLAPDALIENHGLIETTNVSATAIQALSDTSEIANFGEIVTRGSFANGVYAGGSNNYVENTGSILAASRRSSGILSIGDGSYIDNSGAIVTEDEFSWGIYVVGDDNDVVSSGFVVTEGADSQGLQIDGNGNTAANSGSILASAANANGLVVTGDRNSIINSGAIVSQQSYAVAFLGTDNSLELIGSAWLGGVVFLGGGTTVDVTTAVSHSVLWDFSSGTLDGTVNVTGAMPHFYNPATRQLATYDPSGLTHSVNALADMTGLLSDVLRGRIGRPSLPGELPSGAAAASGGGMWPGFWGGGFGGGFDHEATASALAGDIDLTGFALGYTWEHDAGIDMSVMGGYLASGIDVLDSMGPVLPGLRSHSIKSRGWFAGLGASGEIGGVAVDAGLTGGVLSHDSSRLINDNLAPDGEYVASGAYDSWFLSPEVGVSVNRDLGQGWIVTPATRLRLAMQSFEAYRETGPSQANADIGGFTAAIVESRSEIALTRNAGFGSITGQLGFLARASVGDEAVSASLLGTSRQVSFGGAQSTAFYAGAGTGINLGPNARLSFEGRVYFGGDFSGVEGQSGLRIKF